jgi:heat shock protein HspQ
MTFSSPVFHLGQLVVHKLHHYRGVIIDIDPYYLGKEESYQSIAAHRPNKYEPWYYVLVHNATHQTYVAEQDITPDDSHEPIQHPEIENYFSGFYAGRYLIKQPAN